MVVAGCHPLPDAPGTKHQAPGLLERPAASVALRGLPERQREAIEVQAVGSADGQGSAPMARDSIFRIASITKPITATAVMMLVEDGRIALDDPVGHWLPELASPVVVRSPAGPVDDAVPAARPITVADLLTSRCRWPDRPRLP